MAKTNSVDPQLEVSNEPSIEALNMARQLLGHPHVYGKEQEPLLRELQRFGIACDFGDEGWARGFRWHEYYRKG